MKNLELVQPYEYNEGERGARYGAGCVEWGIMITAQEDERESDSKIHPESARLTPAGVQDLLKQVRMRVVYVLVRVCSGSV